MPLHMFDQRTQVHSSETYTDNTAPSEANFETNVVDLEGDLNSVRSMLHELRDVQSSNWWAALTAPTTFTSDSPSVRGVQDVAEDLWDLERQRILRRREVIGADIAVPACVAATGVLTLAANPGNNETVTIDTKTYTFQTVLTDVDGNVLIGATASDSIDNLIAAITLGAGSGTLYAASTTLHPTATAAAGAGDTMDATAKTSGTGGNSIATTETLAAVGSQWAAATLTGGAGDVVILGTGELPGNTTAAVGAVTTLGTVVAYESSFGTATLTEVAGADALSPKNMCKIANTNTGEPILDGSGNEIHALLQSESNTDGHTIGITTPNRVQLSFVVHNATNDDLELVDCTYIGGQSIDYAPVERYALADMPEHAWLGNDFVDAGAAAVTRQAVYDNQGTTPVDLTNNAILDIEAAGGYWEIRDDAEATLFRITEGSAGGTSTVAIEDDVDNFDVDAVDVDFDAGISVRTGGSRPIDVGINDGVVETTAGDLELQAAAEIWFDDGNKPAGWSLTQGVKLSEDAQEWTDIEAAFGEVSLYNMLLQLDDGASKSEAWAVVTGNIDANTNITGAGGSPNIDAQMPSYKGIDPLSTNYGVWLYINGQKQRPGADQAAGMDWYPHPTAANQATGDFYMNKDLRVRGGGSPPDSINMVVWGTPDP